MEFTLFLPTNTVSVCELFHQVLSSWMMDQPPLGHKSPKPGYARLVYCPACRDFNSIPVLLTSRHASFLNTVIFLFRHVLENCVAVSAVREAEGIQSFLELSREAGLSRVAAYRAYILGQDCRGVPVQVDAHLARGDSLSRLTDAWLSMWFEEED